METITEALEKLKEETMEVDDSEMYETTIEPTQAEEEFAKEIYKFIQDITKRDTTITENFANITKLTEHYNKHCIAGDNTKVSIRSNVFYDFNTLQDYKNYVEEIEDKANLKSDKLIRVDSLYNIQEIINAFRKLFEGNFTLTFSSLCGFISTDGKSVSIGFNAFANKYTENYTKGNTINYIMFDYRNTKTLFPLDANYLQNKFNLLVTKWNTKYNTPFQINH